MTETHERTAEVPPPSVDSPGTPESREPVGSLESLALIVGAIAFVGGAVVEMIVHWGRSLEISGRGSLGDFVAIGGAVVGALAFVAGRISVRRGRAARIAADELVAPGARLHWFDVAALAIAHGLIALLGWIGAASVVERSFQGAVVYPLPAAALAGVALAVTAYVSFLSAVRMTPMLLSLVLAVFLVVGAFASMLSSSDPLWWQKNLSSLGITNDVSALAFNLTLIVAGLIVTIVARYATAGLPATTRQEVRGRTIVRYGLVIIGIFLACVGIFPVSEYFLLHNTVATGMAVAYAVLVIGLPWFVPTMPRVFVGLGYVYVGVIVVLAIFFATGYYNLTAVELVAAVLIFSWIIVFLRYAGSVARPESAGMRTGPDAAASDPVAAIR
ncbi:hypothetical protein [Agromyces sp. H66]|uniref:hypothetical protein n=1 Tax=Agromyces sp. H66 TaxID=2529859 RepID=UPI0020BEA525|nr:hypothetical protein [Agromyces sp. H66]